MTERVAGTDAACWRAMGRGWGAEDVGLSMGLVVTGAYSCAWISAPRSACTSARTSSPAPDTKLEQQPAGPSHPARQPRPRPFRDAPGCCLLLAVWLWVSAALLGISRFVSLARAGPTAAGAMLRDICPMPRSYPSTQDLAPAYDNVLDATALLLLMRPHVLEGETDSAALPKVTRAVLMLKKA